MSVPKVRRVSSGHHVSDRLRRAKNCSSERNTSSTHFEESAGKSFKTCESTTRIQMISRSKEESKGRNRSTSNRRQFFELKQSNNENSRKLPEKVLKLVVTPCTKDYEHSDGRSTSPKNDDFNVFEIYIEVLKELRQEIKRLEGVNAYPSFRENSILGLIKDCFQGSDDSSRSSSVGENRQNLLQYAKTLAVECVEIIGRVVYQQAEVVLDLNEESSLSTRKKIKKLLLNVMLGIEHELVSSDKILEIVDSDLHYPSFQFIYCLLKYFIEKIASHLVLSREGLSDHCKDLNGDKRSVGSNTFVQTDSEQAVIPEHKIEEYSNRLDNLMKQWTGTGDSRYKIENSQRVVIDCYHCQAGNKTQELLLETVSRFTDKIKREQVNCQQADLKTNHPIPNETEDALGGTKIKEPSSDTICSTEMSTYYSWVTTTGQNSSRRDKSRNLSQYSNCQRRLPNVLSTRSNSVCQICSRNNSGNLFSPPLANGSRHRRMSPPISNDTNYHSISQPMSGGRNNNYCRIPPTTNRTTIPPIVNCMNYSTLSPPMALQPFPKLQLPNFNLCNTIGTQKYPHVPRSVSPVGAKLMHKHPTPIHRNQMTGNECGRCLVICENNPKPPYYDRFPGFKNDGFYGRKFVNSFQPQLFSSFPVSPAFEDENKVDKSSKKDKNKERKSTPSEKGRKSTTSDKGRRSISPFRDRRSLSPINDSETKQVNGRKSEVQKLPARDDKKQENGETDDKRKKDKSKKERNLDRDSTKNENENEMKPKENDKNKDEKSKNELLLVGTPSPSNSAKPSASSNADTSKPDALRKNDRGKPLGESKSREEGVEDQNRSSKPSHTDGKANDDHCTCCKCKQNDGNNAPSPVFVSPCYCNGMNNQDPNGFPIRPIYQFFSSPAPVACNCQNKSGTAKSPSEDQKSKSRQQVDPSASNASQKKRESIDAETQTRKKPSNKTDSERYNSEPSTGQMTPAHSKDDQEPHIEPSDSCTCTVTYSQSCSRHRKDRPNVDYQTQKNESKNSQKSGTKCECPQDIEAIFQNFDDRYSKCVQEIKLLIREGYIPRCNGSDESFTVTREIKIAPSRSNASRDDKPSKVPQQLSFHSSQDKVYSDDSYQASKSYGNQIPPDLRDDIEELKRLVKNTKIGHCPCCKCCKCEEGGNKTVEGCPKDEDRAKDLSGSKKQLDQKEPVKYQSGSSANTGKLPKRHSSKEIEESNREPPEGATIIHISSSYVEPELPPDVENLIVTSESTTTKTSYNETRGTKKPDPNKSQKQEVAKPKKQGETKYLKQDETKYLEQVQTKSSKSSSSANSLPHGPGGGKNKRESGTSITHGSSANIQTKPKSGKETSKLSQNSVPEKSDYEKLTHDSNQMKKIGKEPKPGSGAQQSSWSEDGKLESGVVHSSKPVSGQQGLSAPNTSEGMVTMGDVEGSSPMSTQQEGDTDNYGESQKAQSKEGMKVTDVTYSDGKLSITISGGTVDADKESGGIVGSDTGKRMRNQKTAEPDQEPILADEGEYTRQRQETQEKAPKIGPLAWGNGLKNEENEALSKQNVDVKLLYGGDDRKMTRTKPQKNNTLVYDDEANKQRQMSLERQALDESREQLFGKRSDRDLPVERRKSYVPPSNDGDKKSWNPFGSIFGVFGGKNENIEEYSKRAEDKIDEELKSEESECKRKDDIDSDFSSCNVGPPCGAANSSCSTIDECQELLDSLPCNFYSDVSVASTIKDEQRSEVINETDTELYVMIIESQSPVNQTTEKHDEIISLLLSGNNNCNVDLSGNGNADNYSTYNHSKTTTQSNARTYTTPKRSHDSTRSFQNVCDSYPGFPVELISHQPSYESVTQGSDVEPSDERLKASSSKYQPLALTSINPPNLQVIPQQEMREQKTPSDSKQDGKERHPSPCRKPKKKKRPGHDTEKHPGDQPASSLKSRINFEKVDSAKKTENKEVQVTKWNARVQTAGPRKFNRTDIPREVEDKLAAYLGLERTAEQMDLKVLPTKKAVLDNNDNTKPKRERSRRRSENTKRE